MFTFNVRNTTGSDVLITDLGIIIPNGTTRNLGDTVDRSDLSSSIDIRALINDTDFRRRNDLDTINILAVDAFKDVDLFNNYFDIINAALNGTTGPEGTNPFITESEGYAIADSYSAAAADAVDLDTVYDNDADGIMNVDGANDLTLRSNGTNDIIIDGYSGSGILFRTDVASGLVILGNTGASPVDTRVEGKLVVAGDLLVQGTTTTVNSNTLDVTDNTIRVNKDEVGAGVTLGTAGLQVERGSLTDAYSVFDESSDRWQVGIGSSLSNILREVDFTTAGGDNGIATTVARGDHIHDSRYYTETELSSTSPGQGASLIGINDADGYYTATTVEGALAELAASIGTSSLDIKENGSTVVTGAASINFVDGLVATSGGGGQANVNVDYFSGTPAAGSQTGSAGAATTVARGDHVHVRNTLDESYDAITAGSGRTIITDTGAVVLDRGSATTVAFRIVPHTAVPTGTPLDGDIAIVNDTVYRYDGTRSKWLSIARTNRSFSEHGSADSSYLPYGNVSSAVGGARMLRDGTLVGVASVAAGGNASKGLEVRKNGVATSLYSFSLASSVFTDTAVNVNFSAGDYLQVFAVAAGTGASDISVDLEIAWRI